MYIQRSTLLLFFFIYLVFLIGLNWIRAPESSWVRPFIVALSIVIASFILQRYPDDNDQP